MTTNIFDDPAAYRKELLGKGDFLLPSEENFSAKSLICVFFTRFCGVGCPFCFFQSPIREKSDIRDNFNRDGVEKLIEFARDTNVGYLQISGGGEPFLEKEAILESIRRVDSADRIILVTSGMWATSKKGAAKWLRDLKEALDSRERPTRLSIRLSVSEGHSIKLKNAPLINLLELFQEEYWGEPNFTLQLKTFVGDSVLYDQIEEHFGGFELKEIGADQSDDSNLIKIMPWKSLITLPSGFQVICGKSRVFGAGLRPNMNDHESIRHTVEVYDHDTEKSQKFMPSVVFDSEGRKGFDWIVEYNGNICTWQNRLQDSLMNIYEDDYEAVVAGTMRDPISRSFVEKGALYRDRIISEVSPKTVDLMKAVGVRDYAGNMLFQDEKIQLYYNIRVIQDYLAEGKVTPGFVERLSPPLRGAIALDKKFLSEQYRKGEYSIIDHEMSVNSDPQRFRDFLELVKLGHFEVCDRDVDRALAHYREISGEDVFSLDQITHEAGLDVERRLTDRVIQIKDMPFLAKDCCTDNYNAPATPPRGRLPELTM